MQRHPLQFGSANPGYPGCLFLPGRLLEASSLADRRLVCDDFEERRAHRHSDLARQLCRSRIPVRQTAPRRGSSVLYARIALAGTARLDLTAEQAESAYTGGQLTSALLLRILT